MEQHINTYTQPLSATSTAQRLPLLRRFALWIALARQRRQMKKMTDAQLADMGLTRSAVDAEAKRPFWDVPANWKS